MLGQAKLKKQFHSVHALHYHLVVVTKYRHRCITEQMLARLREIASERCIGWGGELLEMNGEPDHLHLLIRLPPTLNLSDFVNSLKTTTSRLIRKEFSEHLAPYYWKPIFWSRSYCLISCGGAPLTVIRQYIEQQAGVKEEAR